MRIAVIVTSLLLAGCAAPPEPTEQEPAAPPAPVPTQLAEGFVAGMEPEWGAPEERALRPGINMEYDGASCTTSFLFQHEWARYFIATAAHCVAGGNGCDVDREMPDKNATLLLVDGGEAKATVAYHAWTTMSRVEEDDRNACAGNDFALLELDPADLPLVHPASLHFRAPTGLAEAPTEDIWGFGASILKQGAQETHPKQGKHMGMGYDGWQHHVYLASPGIPGDSGGHIMTADGKALGIASTLVIAPSTGSNFYTDVRKPLEYMQEHEGWAPELVTWDDFHASLV